MYGPRGTGHFGIAEVTCTKGSPNKLPACWAWALAQARSAKRSADAFMPRDCAAGENPAPSYMHDWLSVPTMQLSAFGPAGAFMHDVAFGTLLYRFFFFGWLYKDASHGNVFERAAALRYNK